MLTRLNFAVLAVCIGALGCAQVPQGKLRDYASQEVVRTSRHWGDLARAMTSEMLELPISESLLKGRVYIAPGNSDSAFDRTFREYLISSISSRGISISRHAGNATVVINFKADTFLHTDFTKEKTWVDYKTIWFVLGRIGYEFNRMSGDMQTLNIASLAAIWDVLDDKKVKTNAEVAVTLSVEDYESVKYKNVVEFYIDRNDLLLYWSDKPPVANQIPAGNLGRVNPAKTLEIKRN